MNFYKLSAIALAVGLLAGCSTFDPKGGPTYQAGPNYTANGSVSGVRAFIYGDRTVLQYDSAPVFLSVADDKGNSVDYEEVGGYYRFSRKVDHFTARANLLKATSFNVLPASLRAPVNPSVQAPVAAKPVSPMVYTPVTTKADEPLPLELDPREAVKLTSEEDAQLKELLKVSQDQLQAVRAAIEQGAPDLATLELMRARLDGIQANLAAASGAVIMVHFKPYKTDFDPSSEVGALLVQVAQQAETVKIRGRTDSYNPGSLDGKIAKSRADSARLFLVSRGVDPAKIKVSSMAAGDRIAPNNSQQGRDVNRRVEIEIVNSRIAGLLRQPRAVVATTATSSQVN